MMTKRVISILAMLGLTSGIAEAGSNPVTAEEVMKKAKDVVTSYKTLSYQAVFEEMPNDSEMLLLERDADAVFVPVRRQQDQTYSGSVSRFLLLRNREGLFKIAAGLDGEHHYFVDFRLEKVRLRDPRKEVGKAQSGGGTLSTAHPFFVNGEFPGVYGDTSVKLLNSAEIDGERCYRIEASNGDYVSVFWIDEDEWVLRAQSDSRPSESGRITQTTRYQVDINPDFRNVSFVPDLPEGFRDMTVAELKAEQAAKRAEYYRNNPRKLSVEVGEQLEDWELKDLDGNAYRLSDQRGKVVLMDFWSTWCGPCKAAMPSMQKLHDKYKDQGLQLFGISMWERDPEDAPEFVEDVEYSYQFLLNGDELGERFDIPSIPTFMLVDKEGKLSMFHIGHSKEVESELDKAIKELL